MANNKKTQIKATQPTRYFFFRYLKTWWHLCLFGFHSRAFVLSMEYFNNKVSKLEQKVQLFEGHLYWSSQETQRSLRTVTYCQWQLCNSQALVQPWVQSEESNTIPASRFHVADRCCSLATSVCHILPAAERGTITVTEPSRKTDNF